MPPHDAADQSIDDPFRSDNRRLVGDHERSGDRGAARLKQPAFTFPISRFFVRSRDRFFAPTICRSGTCAEAASRLVAATRRAWP